MMRDNIAKIEDHVIHGKTCTCCVHRKGATRALPGQPVLVPGDMGTGSWLLEGKEGNRAFSSSCHGAGRLLSRSQAKKQIDGKALKRELESRGSEFMQTLQTLFLRRLQMLTRMWMR